MNTTRNSQSRTPFHAALAGALLLLLSLPAAAASAEMRDTDVGYAIAAQGNRALVAIRAEQQQAARQYARAQLQIPLDAPVEAPALTATASLQAQSTRNTRSAIAW